MKDCAIAAPNLEILRLVYEYPGTIGGLSNVPIPSDVTLNAIAMNCPKLNTLAISKTDSMTSQGFINILQRCPIKTIDFHW